MTEQAVVPEWVKVDLHRVADLDWTACGLATQLESLHAHGQCAALGWVLAGHLTPMTRREERAIWEQARAESWLALCVAAGQQRPSAREWAQLGVTPRACVFGDEDFAHGVWRTLAWLLGVHPDPPTELPDRDADGQLVSPEPRYGLRRDVASPLWQRVDQRWRARNQAEARRWCAHVRRQLADAEPAPAPARPMAT